MREDTPQYHYKSLQSDDTAGPRGLESPTPTMNRTQGYILIAIAGLTLILLGWFVFKPVPKYAYKVINVQAQFSKVSTNVLGLSPENNSRLNGTNVNFSDDDLTLLGKEGWELVDTILEMETTHPNYGNTEYVSGLQPNIRPQRAVLLFRRPI